jgi:hypothetical protein
MPMPAFVAWRRTGLLDQSRTGRAQAHGLREPERDESAPHAENGGNDDERQEILPLLVDAEQMEHDGQHEDDGEVRG